MHKLTNKVVTEQTVLLQLKLKLNFTPHILVVTKLYKILGICAILGRQQLITFFLIWPLAFLYYYHIYILHIKWPDLLEA
jgi:hypothetical protein